MQDLSSRLNQFASAFNGKPVAEITATEIDDWLRGLPVAATTRNNFRRVLIVAFNFATSRGYCVTNHAEAASKAKQIEGEVEILTVNELKRLLEVADAKIIPFIAIGAFAGLRRAELERLDWSEVDLGSELIQVKAKKAKSARRRWVKIKPTLVAWISPHARLKGAVAPSNYRELLDAARMAAKIENWPHNGLRHSFASYHLAEFNDVAALALELGHTNANLVFQHYRQAVKPAEAAKYWRSSPSRIRPAERWSPSPRVESGFARGRNIDFTISRCSGTHSAMGGISRNHRSIFIVCRPSIGSFSASCATSIQRLRSGPSPNIHCL